MSVFEHLEIAPVSGATDSVIIILHGYGSNAERSVVQAKGVSEALPNAHVYAPNGTYHHVAVMDPKGEGMSDQPSPGRHVWYHRYSEKTRQEGLAVTLEKLEAYIDECAVAQKVERSRVSLIGMSQGAITLMHCVPRLKTAVGAAISHSGYLFSPDSLAQRVNQVPEFKAAVVSKTPSCFIHGLADFILPWQTALEGATQYDEAGIPVEFHLLTALNHADMESRSQVLTAEFIRRHVYAREAAGVA